MHHYLSDEVNDKWCYLREAQMEVTSTITDTYLTVAIDCGEYNNIHPIHKKEIGHRLAL